jgi:hypothetical protein
MDLSPGHKGVFLGVSSHPWSWPCCVIILELLNCGDDLTICKVFFRCVLSRLPLPRFCFRKNGKYMYKGPYYSSNEAISARYECQLLFANRFKTLNTQAILTVTWNIWCQDVYMKAYAMLHIVDIMHIFPWCTSFLCEGNNALQCLYTVRWQHLRQWYE